MRSSCSMILIVILISMSQIGAQEIPSTREASPTSGQCVTPNGKSGSCVSLLKCTSLINLIRKQPLINEDKAFLRSSQCGFENRMVFVCCPDEQENITDPTTPINSHSAKLSLLPQRGKCGNMVINRIFRGRLTDIDSYNWMALLEYSKGRTETGHHCGGALINNRYILTAAHCVTNLPKTWSLKRVRLGEWDTSTDRDCEKFANFDDCAEPHVDVSIEKIIPHERYEQTSIARLHDIALIRLTSNINTTEFIQPICLPVGENIRDNLEKNLELAGWGATSNGLSKTVKERSIVRMMPLSDCRQKYAQRNVSLETSQLCVESQLHNEACHMDSGGPIIGVDTSVRGRASFFIAGVQSIGHCWLEGWPSVYTKVSDYVDWILENIQP